MRLSVTKATHRALAALALFAVLGPAPLAADQHEFPVRVTIATSGRAVLDALFQAMTAGAGLSMPPTVRYAEPLPALREFCRAETVSSPDIVLAAHHMQAALAAECAKNSTNEVIEVELARNALILAVRSGSALTRLTSRQVYLAIAREVPYRDRMTRNTAVRWADVDSSLPPEDIRFQLPMREEGSRATFDSLVLQAGCRNESAVKAVFDAQQRTQLCVTPRTDRVRELPRPQALKALLDAPVGTVGVLSQSEIEQAKGELVGLTLDGMAPTPEAIRDASYDVSSSFWLYAKRGEPDVERLLARAESDSVLGPSGPLPGLGLVPLPEEERAAQRAILAARSTAYVGSILGWLVSTGEDAWRMFGISRRVPMPANMANALDFTTLMDLAGYQISSVQSSIGIIPDASMTFGIAREMSDADHHYLDRILYRDSLARPGAIAAMQRRIIRSILEVREVGGFEVSKVEIDFLPLPKVALEVTPKGGGKSGREAEGE